MSRGGHLYLLGAPACDPADVGILHAADQQQEPITCQRCMALTSEHRKLIGETRMVELDVRIGLLLEEQLARGLSCSTVSP